MTSTNREWPPRHSQARLDQLVGDQVDLLSKVLVKQVCGFTFYHLQFPYFLTSGEGPAPPTSCTRQSAGGGGEQRGARSGGQRRRRREERPRLQQRKVGEEWGGAQDRSGAAEDCHEV